MKRNLWITLATAAAAALIPGTASAQAYLDLGPGQATGVSTSGKIVSGSGAAGAFRWTQSGGAESLPGASTAVGISLDGATLTGQVNSGNAGVWNADTGWIDLGGTPGSGGGCSNLSSPYAISGDGGVAVGLGWDTCARAFAFKWTPGGGMEELPTLGPNSSRANAVSGDGLTIGGWDEAANGTRRAKLWFDDGSQLLPLEGEPNNPAGAGEVWGFSTDGSIACGGSFEGAFLWTAAGGVQQLGELIPRGGGTAYAVSDDGLIAVGTSGTFFTGNTAFIWIQGQGLQSLADYAANQGVVMPAGTALGFALDMTPDGKTVVGQAGLFPFSNAFYLTFNNVDFYSTGASAANVLVLRGTGAAAIGEQLTVTTSNVAPGAETVLLALARKPAETPLLGGMALVDLGTIQGPLLRATPVDGVASWTLRIPDDPSLVGLVGYAQSLARDPAQAGGWAFSNGLRIAIRDN